MGRTRTESNAHNFQTVDQRTDPGHGRKPAAATRAKELLTDRIVRELPAPVRGAKITYDGGDPNKRVSGFGVRVTTAGQRAFILNYWIRGLERRCTIGRFPDWNTSDARAKAKELKREIDQGGDPLLEERKEREAPTMRDLIERWHAVKAPKKTSERSRREDESLIRQWIDPELGNRKVAELRASHIDRLHHKITAHGTPVRANRTIALVKHLFNLAIRWELRADNPAAGIEWNHEEPVGRYLEGDELDRLVAALAADRNQTAADAIRLMVLTGARSGEVFKAVWPQFDLEAGVWTKPSSHTKRKRSHRVPLSAAATQLLLGMKEQAAARAAATAPAITQSVPGRAAERSHRRRQEHLAPGLRGRGAGRHSHPRSAAQLREPGRQRWGGSAGDRQAARPHAIEGDNALCPPVRQSVARRDRPRRCDCDRCGKPAEGRNYSAAAAQRLIPKPTLQQGKSSRTLRPLATEAVRAPRQTRRRTARFCAPSLARSVVTSLSEWRTQNSTKPNWSKSRILMYYQL